MGEDSWFLQGMSIGVNPPWFEHEFISRFCHLPWREIFPRMAATKAFPPVFLLLFLLGSTDLIIGALPPPRIVFCTFNVTLNRFDRGAPIPTLLSNPAADAPRRIAEIIQRIKPDVLLLNEFDYDDANPNGAGSAPQLFQQNFLSIGQNISGSTQPAITYAYRYVAPVNTGYPSGFDYDREGTVNTTVGTELYGNDCLGFGRWPGQYGMVIFSKFPIDTANVRTFQKVLWKDMPGAALPDFAGTPTIPADWYSPAALNVFRISSKSHWDVPINFNSHIVHLLVDHPTPPTFDGAEDRNGRRNHDEIKLWADYLSPRTSGYIKDDAGVPGGLAEDERFVIMGDHNADPFKGDSYLAAIRQLLDHSRVNALYSPARPNLSPPSAFGTGYYNSPAYDTAAFAGGVRVDYVLPSKVGMKVISGYVYWPVSPDTGTSLITVSDHHAVQLTMALTPVASQAVKNLRISYEGGNVVLRWQGRTGYAYTISQTPNLQAPWLTTPTIPVTVDPGTFQATATDVAPSAGRKFYRVEITFQ